MMFVEEGEVGEEMAETRTLQKKILFNDLMIHQQLEQPVRFCVDKRQVRFHKGLFFQSF